MDDEVDMPGVLSRKTCDSNTRSFVASAEDEVTLLLESSASPPAEEERAVAVSGKDG